MHNDLLIVEAIICLGTLNHVTDVGIVKYGHIYFNSEPPPPNYSPMQIIQHPC